MFIQNSGYFSQAVRTELFLTVTVKRQKQTDFIDGVLKNIATDKKYFDQCLTEITGKLCNPPTCRQADNRKAVSSGF